MALTVGRITVQFPYTTGLPRDVSENVFHFMAEDGDPETMFDFWSGRLEEMYNVDHTGSDGHALSEYLARAIDHPHCKMLGAGVNVTTGHILPVGFTHNWTLNNPSGTAQDLPFEVAVCSSVKANRTDHPGPVGRRRGRFYLGPLTAFALQGTSGDSRVYPNPSDDLINQLKQASLYLADGGVSEDGLSIGAAGEWCIYSRADHGTYPIKTGFVDNEFDTQRRRGTDPTARSTWTRAEPI